MNVNGGESDAATTALEGAVAGFPDTKIHTEAGLVTSRDLKDFSTVLQPPCVLLGTSSW